MAGEGEQWLIPISLHATLENFPPFDSYLGIFGDDGNTRAVVLTGE